MQWTSFILSQICKGFCRYSNIATSTHWKDIPITLDRKLPSSLWGAEEEPSTKHQCFATHHLTRHSFCKQIQCCRNGSSAGARRTCSWKYQSKSDTARKTLQHHRMRIVSSCVCCESIRHYLLGWPFFLYTDYLLLQNGRTVIPMGTCIIGLWLWNKIPKGSNNTNADALSSIPSGLCAATQVLPELASEDGQKAQQSDRTLHQIWQYISAQNKQTSNQDWKKHPLKRYAQILKQLHITDYRILCCSFVTGPLGDTIIIPVLPPSFITDICPHQESWHHQCWTSGSTKDLGTFKTLGLPGWDGTRYSSVLQKLGNVSKF